MAKSFHAELGKIKHAKPAPRTKPPSGEELEHATKVSTPGGGTMYVLPNKTNPTATAAVPGCVKRAPQPPGVTARRIGPARVLVTYRIGGEDGNCRAEWIELVPDVSGDYLGGDLSRFRVADDRSGQIILDLASHVVDADVLVASTRTKEYSGFASRSITIRIR